MAKTAPGHAANTESGRGGHGAAPGTEGFARTTPPGEERGGTGAVGAFLPSRCPASLPFLPVPLSALTAARSAWISLLAPATGSRGNSAPASRENGGAGAVSAAL